MVKLSLTQWHKKQLTLQREGYLPQEACALLLGRIDGDRAIVENICPIKNIAYTDEFLMDAQQQGNIMMVVDQGKKFHAKIVAYYHSHPPGCAGYPSSTDLARAQEGWYEGIHIIHGRDGIRAYIWNGTDFTETEVEYSD